MVALLLLLHLEVFTYIVLLSYTLALTLGNMLLIISLLVSFTAPKVKTGGLLRLFGVTQYSQYMSYTRDPFLD